MKLTTWNVNGLRACLGKGFLDYVAAEAPDILCLQETKMQEGQADVPLAAYRSFWNSAEKKGYSGTAIFTKVDPLSAAYDIDAEGHDREGRAITLEFEGYYLVNVYTPNAQDGLARIDYRMEWEDAFRDYVSNLDRKKPVILCGDLNVAHQEIDIKNAKSNHNNAGFTDEEREKFTLLLQSGFVDSFRHLYPDKRDAYTWWSYFGNARTSNTGWRIDYFVVSRKLKDGILGAGIHPDILGSDHCPVELTI